jgi:hypothetical protein
MSTTDWPARITPAAAQWQLQKAGTQFASPFNGTPQAVDYVAERWAVSLSLPNQLNPGAVAALLNNLAGGVNRVNLWHHGSGGQPAGSLRGTPVLSSAAARGDASIALSGCTGRNLLINGSFEADANANGVADQWNGYQNGSTGAVSFGLSSASSVSGSYAQRVTALALGTSGSGFAGVYQSLGVPGIGGQPVVFSAYVAAYDGNPSIRLWLTWRDGGTTLRQDSQLFSSVGSVLVRKSVSVVAPAGANAVDCIVWMQDRSGVAGVSVFDVDAAQLEYGSAVSDFERAPTLLAGDLIGCSGHLFQVASDCQADDAGAMTVPIINRVRGTIASGTAVTWYKPTAQFIMPAMAAGSLQVPGYTQGAALDLLEVW